jgi:condensin complex subunit 3
MLERLRDKVPLVRAQAARALSRLQDGGDSNDFSEDAITAAFVQLLGAEKNKDVRKAILGSLAISDHTIPYVVERTRDASEDVRRVAFLALSSKVRIGSTTPSMTRRHGPRDQSS